VKEKNRERGVRCMDNLGQSPGLIMPVSEPHAWFVWKASYRYWADIVDISNFRVGGKDTPVLYVMISG
jgi:hypothetical protein